MISVIAIDDEPKAIDVIKHHIAKNDDLQLIATFTNADAALSFLKENPIDLVLLDINMPQKSGLELLDELHFKPLVVFTTAYAEFALESYDYEAVDYLLKPFDFDRFQLAIQKVEKKISALWKQKSYFFIKDGFKSVRIEFDDILYIQGAKNYLDIVTTSKTHSPRMTFSEIIQSLPASEFVRVHQSYIVHLKHIEKIENNHIFIKELNIPISEKYKNILYKKMPC